MPGVVTLPEKVQANEKNVKDETKCETKVMKRGVRDFEKDYEECYKHFDPYSKEPLVVGRYEDYDRAALEAPKHSIFVHDNVVYRICNDCDLHESSADGFRFAINNSLVSAFGDIFFGLGSATRRMFNYHGCCSPFGKMPDFSFCLKSKFKGYPALVGEVGVTHENQHQLFMEAMVYLNSYTSVQYCILVNIVPSRRHFLNVRVVVCERALECFDFSEAEQAAFQARKEEAKERKENNVSLPDDDKDVCVDIQDKRNGTRQEIEDNYRLRVIFDQTIRLTSASERVTEDLVFYLRRDLLLLGTSGIDTRNIPELVPIRITAETLNYIIEEFNGEQPQT